MSYLRKQNVKHCVSLLREYIDNTPSGQGKRKAVLALEQLRQISAGSNGETTTAVPLGSLNCNGRPRVNSDAA